MPVHIASYVQTLVISLRKFCARKKAQPILIYALPQSHAFRKPHLWGTLEVLTDQKGHYILLNILIASCLFKRYYHIYKSRFCRDLSYLYPFKYAVEILKQLLRKHSVYTAATKKNIDLSCQKSQISSTMSLKSHPQSSITSVVGENQNIQ